MTRKESDAKPSARGVSCSSGAQGVLDAAWSYKPNGQYEIFENHVFSHIAVSF